MAVVSRKDYGYLCDREVNYVHTMILRGKILAHGERNKLIDTENPINKAFFKNIKDIDKEAKRKLTARPKKKIDLLYSEVVEQVKNAEVPIYTKPESDLDKAQREIQNKFAEEAHDWDLRKKRADALKAEQQAEKERLAVEKMMAQLIPVNLVKAIIKINIQNILHSFTAECSNIASIFCDTMAGGDRTMLAEATKDLQEALQTIINRASSTAAKEVENVVDEFIDTRNQGQKNITPDLD